MQGTRPEASFGLSHFSHQYILVELGATFSLILVLVKKLESKASILSWALSICKRQNWTLMIVSCAHGRDTRGPPSGCSTVCLPLVLVVQGRCQLPCYSSAVPWGGVHRTIEESLEGSGLWQAPGGWVKWLSRTSCRKHLQTSACPSTHTPLLWGRLLSVGVSTVAVTCQPPI